MTSAPRRRNKSAEPALKRTDEPVDLAAPRSTSKWSSVGGALLDASGLQPTSKGARIKFSGGKRTLIDGPFSEAKELIGGYTLIQVKSKEEAMEWAKRFPAPHGEGADGEIEIRQLYELEDFGSSETLDRFREIGIGTKK